MFIILANKSLPQYHSVNNETNKNLDLIFFFGMIEAKKNIYALVLEGFGQIKRLLLFQRVWYPIGFFHFCQIFFILERRLEDIYFF